ncbi:MAG: EAL domain-containing protein, partial [Firmicutes bacterium]|nr:EAL domain-containing protein [Bacillota bacterium]
MKEGKTRFQLTYRRCTREGKWHWIESTALVYMSPRNDDILSFTVSRSVDDQKAQEDLQRRLLTDTLTGLYSREGFFEKAQEMIAKETEELYIVRLNICHFKLLNELRGTEKCDKLLRNIGASYLEKGQERGFVAARFAADQFYLCIRRRDFEQLEIVKRVSVSWLKMDITVTYGVCPVDDKTPINVMCDRADMALSSNNHKVLENVFYYDDDVHRELLQEQEFENDMEQALEEGQFCIYVQPKFDVGTDKIVGGEALVRWNHPVKGMIPPYAFIKTFEKNGFILKLDYFVWEESCRFMAKTRENGLPHLPVSVNVSRLHFYSGELQDKLTELLEKYNLKAEDLELEITESIYADDPDIILEQCGVLQNMGFRIAMDDFGSGFSSLNMLRRMPLDIIKMDLRFLTDDADSNSSMKGRDILRTQINLAHNIGLDVVVEGLETSEQKDFIREISNCMAQGYYYAKPMPVSDFTELIKTELPESAAVYSSGMAAELRRERLRREQLQPQLELISAAENLFGYLLPEKEAVLSPKLAQSLNCPQRVPDLANYLAQTGIITSACLPQCTKLIEAAERGERSGAAIIEFVNPQGELKPYWIRFSTVLDFEGNPLIAMTSIADFDDISEKVELLMASRKTQAEEENLQLKEQVKETKKIFQIVSEHSNRILYVYDLATRET